MSETVTLTAPPPAPPAPPADSLPAKGNDVLAYSRNGVEWDLARPDHFRRWVGQAANDLAHMTRLGRNKEGVAMAKAQLEEILASMKDKA